MANLDGHEADQKQLHPTRSVESNYMTNTSQPLNILQHIRIGGKDVNVPENFVRKIQHTILSCADEFSLIEEFHPEFINIVDPNDTPFYWTDSARSKTNVIIDTSKSFGPTRFVELETDVVDEDHLEITIKKSLLLDVQPGCFNEPGGHEKEVEGTKIDLFRGKIIDDVELYSISALINREAHWSEQPKLSLYALIQYWVFHHHEVVDWLKKKEMHDA